MQRAPSESPLNRRRQCSPGPILAITRPSNLLSSVLQVQHKLLKKHAVTLMQTVESCDDVMVTSGWGYMT